MDYIYFSFAMNPSDKKKLELVAGPRGLNTLLRKIIANWVNEFYPDRSAILTKIASLEKEIAELNQYLGNIGQVEATQGMDARTRKQFLEDNEGSVISMLWMVYIKKRADNRDYTNWNEELEFNSIPELKAFLKRKWKEYGHDELIKAYHKHQFVRLRMKEYTARSKSNGLTIEEYMDQHNIDIDDEYENGRLNGSQLQLDKFIEHTG